MTLTEEQREAIRVISKLPMAIGCQLCHPYIMKNYGSHFIVLRDMIDSSGTVEPTGGFDLEKARAADEALPYPLDANEIWVSGKGQMHINPPNAPSIFFTLSDLCEFRNLFHGQAAEIERLRPFEIAARDLDSDLGKIAGERDEQSARIKELEADLEQAERVIEARLEVIDQQAARIKSLKKEIRRLKHESKVEQELTNSYIKHLHEAEARIKELEDAHKRAGAKYAKIIRELRSSVYANIPGLDVGKIGPDASESHLRPYEVVAADLAGRLAEDRRKSWQDAA